MQPSTILIRMDGIPRCSPQGLSGLQQGDVCIDNLGFSREVWQKALEYHSAEKMKAASPDVLRRMLRAAQYRLKWDRLDEKHQPLSRAKTMRGIVRDAHPYQIVSADCYRHERVCDNCQTRFCKHIKRGHRVPKTLECPNCECETSLGRSHGRTLS